MVAQLGCSKSKDWDEQLRMSSFLAGDTWKQKEGRGKSDTEQGENQIKGVLIITKGKGPL